MSMIYFATNGKKDCTTVICRVNTGLDIELPVLLFTWECGSQYAAALLVKHLQENLHEMIEQCHRNGYNQGWQDAKAKKRKKTDFCKEPRSDGLFVAY